MAQHQLFRSSGARAPGGRGRPTRAAAFLAALWLLAVPAAGQSEPPTGPALVGRPAPPFSNIGSDGHTYSLHTFRGRWIVLEWFNPTCPSSRGHYESGTLPRLQREWTARGVVWLAVSTNVRAERAAEFARRQQGAATAILVDTDAATARAYGAKTTPHMFVIDPNGILVYNGALDDRPATDHAGAGGATNFVAAALADGMAGRPVATPTSEPYGCAVHW